jgi:hypothetical protein
MAGGPTPRHRDGPIRALPARWGTNVFWGGCAEADRLTNLRGTQRNEDLVARGILSVRYTNPVRLLAARDRQDCLSHPQLT